MYIFSSEMERYFKRRKKICVDTKKLYRDVWKAITHHLEWPEIIALGWTCKTIRKATREERERCMRETEEEWKTKISLRCRCRRRLYRGHHKSNGDWCAISGKVEYFFTSGFGWTHDHYNVRKRPLYVVANHRAPWVRRFECMYLMVRFKGVGVKTTLYSLMAKYVELYLDYNVVRFWRIADHLPETYTRPRDWTFGVPPV